MSHPVDRSNLRQVILDTPDQFREGFALARDVRLDGSFGKIMLSGMGGSALPGNLFRLYLSQVAKTEAFSVPGIYQNRYYKLPREAFDDCLNFFCSYSGNTEETVASFEEALAKGLPSIGVSAGGRIEEMCRTNSLPHIKLPIPNPDFQPRMGTGYFFASLYQVLVNMGLAPDTTANLVAQAEGLKANMAAREEQGKALASRLKGKTPVIYSSTRYKPVAMIWKIKLNENAKTPAFWNFFPELDHNEMVGFTLPQAKFRVVMLRDEDDHPQNRKRFEITARLLEEHGVETEIIDMEPGDPFAKMFSSLNLGDWTSYYLALEYGQDPTPVEMVEKLKKLLV